MCTLWSLMSFMGDPTCATIVQIMFFPSVLHFYPIISTNTGVNSEFIHVPSFRHHGIEGNSLFLSVETHFPLDEVDIQGTWSHTRPSGTRTTLVTFTKDTAITDMMYRNHLLFKEPNVSLLIQKLKQEDEGEYHLSLNIEFYNKTGLVIKEERTVHVTVDGECFSVMHHVMMTCLTSGGHSPKFTDSFCFFLSPCFHSTHWQEPTQCSYWRQGKHNLDLFC